MEYISASSVSASDPGGEAELNVWNRLKRCFGNDERGVLYHQYPIIEKGGARFDRKPDFVLLHQETGLTILECKGYTIDHIDRIEGDTWKLNTTQQTASPLEQARDQGYHLISYFQRERELRSETGKCSIPMTPVVVLPNIERSEWDVRGFDGPAAPRVITGDELGPKTLRDRLDSLLPTEPLSRAEYRTARDVLSCGQAISGSHGSPPEDPQSRSEYYEKVVTGIKGLDEKQENIGLQIPPGPQQIRGIAGSGKTVLIAMKAARMLSDPGDWEPQDEDTPRIALTFTTKSLYGHITSLVDRFYQQFSGKPLDEAEVSIDIIHGWGGRSTGDGMYYRIANAIDDVPYRTYSQAENAFPDSDDLQEAVAAEVRETGKIPTFWDVILVDEAQDFGPEFLNMCREALTSEDRLIWAYDEAQDLGSLEAPSPKNLFGTDQNGDPRLDLSGRYKSGPQKTYIMRKSYRAPRSLLMAAHALGMGLLRDEGPVQAITRRDGWENIGYEVEGDFRKIGSEAVLTRPAGNSPHPIQEDVKPANLLAHKSFASKADELDWVAERVRADIYDEGLDPEDILVISLAAKRRQERSNRNYVSDELGTRLNRHDIKVNTVWEDRSKTFEKPGEVTLSAVNRAKGNEAASVYVLGVDSTTNEEWRGSELRRRNQLFVALTRSRAWCSLTGANPTAGIHDEIESVLADIQQSQPKISFEVPNSKDLTNELESDTEEFESTALDDFI